MFKFNVNLTDNDYLEYNKFWNFRSHYGKHQLITMRIVLAVVIGIFMIAVLIMNGFSTDGFIGIIPLAILLALMEIFLKRYVTYTLKAQLNSLKKKGKVAYSPVSTLEFYDDYLVEITESNKTEQKYSSIERVSVVRGRAVYLHVNSLMAYILPISAFDNKEQFDSFIEFFNSKIKSMDYYDIR